MNKFQPWGLLLARLLLAYIFVLNGYAKIKNNGVKEFTLTVVDADAKEDGKVVGTCDGGTKKIVYKRGG